MSWQVPDNVRLEIKFAAHESQEDVLREWLNLHSAGFYCPYPERWVNNVYFDTYECFAYSENLSGASSRTKVRYRWYGQHDYPKKGMLEIKCKRNYFGWKLRFYAKTDPSSNTSSWKEIQQNLKQQLEPEAKHWMDSNPQPVMINRYFRKYYVSRDNKVRATIDTKQRVFDQRYKRQPNVTNTSNLPQSLVLEIKFDRNDREIASRIVQGLPVRISRNSKYMIAVQSILGF